MTESKWGSLAPIFDRIVDDAIYNEGVASIELLNHQQLKESIINELSLILNTRCTVRQVIYEDHQDTIPFFGLPDFFGLAYFNSFNATSAQDWPKAAQFIKTAVEAAEPRLNDINVEVKNFNVADQLLIINISGTMVSSKLTQKITFPIGISQKDLTNQKKEVA